jgi:hypothetical protein
LKKTTLPKERWSPKLPPSMPHIFPFSTLPQMSPQIR